MQMQMLLNENSELRRMDSLERIMQPMYSAFKKPSDRSKVVPVNRDAYRSTSKPRLSDSGIKRDTDQEDNLITDLISVGSKISSAAGFQLIKSTD
ncbi:hypothetical protein DL767_002812 [Monosporascus sp. MG133]|nr:hypothetical protein DL767_002812 [Monosporascus sp. MG133]